MPPILNFIHLESRPDRLQNLMEQCSEQSIAYKLWDGVIHNNTVTAISQAHKNIVRDAQEKKLPYVIIAEDDICFSCAGAWKYYLSKMPQTFDLYCGLLYSGEVDSENRIIKGMSATNTLYTISEQFYSFFLMIDESKNLDMELGKFATLNKYILCNPMVCRQMNGKSDHFNRVMNYDPYLQDKKLYGQ